MRGQRTDPEIVAQVTAALLAGMEAAEVSSKFSIPRRTVERMAQNLGPKLAEVGAKKQDELGDLLLSLIDANTAGMKAIARQATDGTYTKKQSPTALADLYRELANTTVRLLEAAAGVSEEQEPAED